MIPTAERTAAAAELRERVNWRAFPKLARIFEHRAPENDHWQELVELVRVEVEEAFGELGVGGER